MRERLGDFSVREKNLWFELVVDFVVALYYYPRVFGLLRAGDGALSGMAMTDLIVNTVLLAVVVSVALGMLVHQQRKPEPKDERDYMIEARSNLWFSRVVIVGVMAVMGSIVLQEFNPWPERALLELTPLVIAHLLLFVLMLSSMINSIMKLLMYRRGA